MHILTFGGKSNLDFGVIISGEDTWVKPAPKVERISVPGRNGDILLPSGAYENVVITYRCGIRRDFDTNYTAFMGHLLSLQGYQRLEDSYHPEVYRMAALVAVEPPAVGPRYRSGEFSLSFDCKPQCWLKTGERELEYKGSTTGTSNMSYDSETDEFYTSIFNPTVFHAKPLIRTQGGYFIVGGVKAEQVASAWRVTIDCENEDAYDSDDHTNCNDQLILYDSRFPTIPPGRSEIRLKKPTGVNSRYFYVTPRWWTL